MTERQQQSANNEDLFAGDDALRRAVKSLKKSKLTRLGRYLAGLALLKNPQWKLQIGRSTQSQASGKRFPPLIALWKGHTHIIDVVTRHKYKANKKINRSYKQINPKSGNSWIAVTIDYPSYSVYFGTHADLEGKKRIPMSDKHLTGYEKLGSGKIPQKIRMNPSNDQVKVPSDIRDGLSRFRDDHPDASNAAFIMIHFGDAATRKRIQQSIRQALSKFGIAALSADEENHHGDLSANVLTYCHGCAFGIAVFDKSKKYQFNPNVTLEVGCMLTLGKPVCLLKDNRLHSLPADLSGKIYKDFNLNNPRQGIYSAVTEWIIDNRLALPTLSEVLNTPLDDMLRSKSRSRVLISS